MNRTRLGVRAVARTSVPRPWAYACSVLLVAVSMSASPTLRIARAEKPKKPDAEFRQRQGVQYLSQSNYAKALEEFRAAIRIDPENAQAHESSL